MLPDCTGLHARFFPLLPRSGRKARPLRIGNIPSRQFTFKPLKCHILACVDKHNGARLLELAPYVCDARGINRRHLQGNSPLSQISHACWRFKTFSGSEWANRLLRRGNDASAMQVNLKSSIEPCVPELPVDVLINIFNHLGTCVTANSREVALSKRGKYHDMEYSANHPTKPSPLLVAAKVCKRWRSIIYSSCIHHVVAQGCTITGGLPLFANLLSLRLDSCMLENPRTDTSKASYSSSFDDDSAFLFSPRHLTPLIDFSVFTQLSRVEISGCLNVCSATFRSLCFCTSLRSLSLSFVNSLVNSDLKGLEQLQSLQQLEISNCQYLTSSALPYIQKIPNLRSMRFDGLAVDRDLTPISECSLETLDILNASTLSDTHLPALARLSSLTRLSLAGSHELSSTALTSLKPLTGLQQLSLARCRLLAGAAAECVTCMRALTALSFSGCCFLDADALGHIARGATALHTLDISGCIALAGPALHQLAPMAHLERLSLARCFFMDGEGLRHVAQLPKLRCLPPKPSFTLLVLTSVVHQTNILPYISVNRCI